MTRVTGLLVTNDFPPKIGGIQSYLHELWRRLPVDDATVFTTPYDGDGRVGRAAGVPGRARARARAAPDAVAGDAHRRRWRATIGASVILLDPWLPLGQLGPRLTAAPYVVVVHGAEVTVPGRLPGSRQLGGRVLRGAAGIVAAGHYPAREAERAAGGALRGVVVPPGVDVDRFRPLADADRARGPRRRSDSIPTGRSCSA